MTEPERIAPESFLLLKFGANVYTKDGKEDSFRFDDARSEKNLRQLIQKIQQEQIPEKGVQTHFSVFAAVHLKLLQRKSLTASRNISPKTVKGRTQRSKNSRTASWHAVQISPLIENLFLQQSISNSFCQKYNTVYAKCKRSERGPDQISSRFIFSA